MSILAEQLDLFTDGRPALLLATDRNGHGWRSRGGGWQLVWRGTRFGWAIRRATAGAWEPWEPDLPYGVPYVHDLAEATRIVEACICNLGDNPNWLTR